MTARERGGLLEGSWLASLCRNSLRLDLLSEVRKKGNLERMLPPDPLLLRPPVVISVGDGILLSCVYDCDCECFWDGNLVSIVIYRGLCFCVLRAGGE